MNDRPPLTPKTVGRFTLDRATSPEKFAFYLAEKAGFNTAETPADIKKAEDLLRLLLRGYAQATKDSVWATARLIQSERGL